MYLMILAFSMHLIRCSSMCAVILSREDVQLHQYGNPALSDKVEPLVETKENEAQSIRNLLPDEDDLFSGIMDQLRLSTLSDGIEDEEDLFQSGGGMELESDNCLNSHQHNSNYTTGVLNVGTNSNSLIAPRHSYEEQSSRRLLVMNFGTSTEDSELRSLLEVHSSVVHKLMNHHEPLNFVLVLAESSINI